MRGGELFVEASAQQVQIAQHLKSPGGAVTMSIGGAILRRDEHWEEMLQRADKRLYRAKSAGRNCIIIDETATAPLSCP